MHSGGIPLVSSLSLSLAISMYYVGTTNNRQYASYEHKCVFYDPFAVYCGKAFPSRLTKCCIALHWNGCDDSRCALTAHRLSSCVRLNSISFSCQYRWSWFVRRIQPTTDPYFFREKNNRNVLVHNKWWQYIKWYYHKSKRICQMFSSLNL